MREKPTQEGVGGFSSRKKRWSSLLPLFVAFVVIAEIMFLTRLDMAKNASMVHTWTNTFYYPSSTSLPVVGGEEEFDINCEDWLEREDDVEYSRDFVKDPILVSGVEEDWRSCSVACKFGHYAASDKKPDAAFGLPNDPVIAGVLRSMEASSYYPDNNLDQARRRGYKVVMTTSLSSDVPVGYFSWAEYDIMAPMQSKTEDSLAAAFISNCGARNFRLQALDMLEKLNIKIDSYGRCHQNHNGRVDKLETLKRYKFSLAFENSNEEDYVTEKYFQSLVAGTIPVVVGAPNIKDFAPSPGSILHVKDLSDVPSIAKAMKSLAENPDAYNQSLRWKYEGPSDYFKALVDMAAVHSSCRLCIHLATKIREQEERSIRFQKRPCNCTRGIETVHHLFVRERGRFEMESIFLRSGNLTLLALESAVHAKFKSLNHVPMWKQERPESIRGDELKVYRIYPINLTQRQALYTFRFSGDADFAICVERNPCAKFEVIFV
ncbi:glycoprotein 3-alpha-L-fucosyltransferase A-like [Tasmannia lanceolata]|uniref:glycoprotein 3-alpha-L-fucosyltransferase A-like n=1 Tax=Tasmannia lanceolata TaxID=3420 RepID=UPI00406286FF